MKTAVFKEDIGYPNCPLYVLDEESGWFLMQGAPEFRYPAVEVYGSGDFFVLVSEEDTLSISK